MKQYRIFASRNKNIHDFSKPEFNPLKFLMHSTIFKIKAESLNDALDEFLYSKELDTFMAYAYCPNPAVYCLDEKDNPMDINPILLVENSPL